MKISKEKFIFNVNCNSDDIYNQCQNGTLSQKKIKLIHKEHSNNSIIYKMAYMRLEPPYTGGGDPFPFTVQCFC